jgi:hypothetical protein
MVKMVAQIKMVSQKLSALNSISPNIKDVSQKTELQKIVLKKLLVKFWIYFSKKKGMMH